MTHTPCPAGHQAALALRLSEAALEGTGWHAVARALEAEVGPGTSLERKDGALPGAPGEASDRTLLRAPDLGTWEMGLPPGSRAELAHCVPVREALALATRLAAGHALVLEDLEAVLDPLPYAAILLDGETRLLFANTAGEDILTSRRLFRPTRPGVRLRPALDETHKALEAAVTHLLRDGGERRGVIRAPDGGHLAMHLRALGPERLAPGAARFVMTGRSIAAAPSMAASCA